MSRIIRCVACARRIRTHHPHYGVEDLESGVEFIYHARPRCQKRMLSETAARLEAARVYVMRHYHVCGDEVCGDEASGFGCRGGCFSGVPDLPRAS
jgi:hypothetical protein